MARNIPLPPSAACLSASMRDLGYSLEAAVADLIDNSISADASKIDIFCEPSVPQPVLVILDNGRGMDAAELLARLRRFRGRLPADFKFDRLDAHERD